MKVVWRDGERLRSVEISPESEGLYRATVDGAQVRVEVEHVGGDRLRIKQHDNTTLVDVTRSGDRRFVRFGALDFVIEKTSGRAARKRGAAGAGLDAPMPGQVTRVLVQAGETVKKGQPLLALEAMKMEHVIRAPRDGKVREVAVKAGEMVNGGITLVEMDGEEE